MRVEETKQTADINAQEQVLSDLPVNDEQANETIGGDTINFHKVKFEYKQFDDKDKL